MENHLFRTLNTLFHIRRALQGRNDYTVRSRSPHRGQRHPSGWRGVGSKLGKVLARVVGDVNRVLLLHAVICVLYGGVAFVMPHSLIQTLFRSTYNHFQHELVRMYGALTLAQGWVVFQVRGVGDGRIRRAICEAFCIAYGLQAVALFRAQLVEPDSHTVLNTVGCLSFAVLAAFYGYCRWFKTIKVFELPGNRG